MVLQNQQEGIARLLVDGLLQLALPQRQIFGIVVVIKAQQHGVQTNDNPLSQRRVLFAGPERLFRRQRGCAAYG